jgi:nucleotide-binding universal stress UspA family protein
MPSAAPPLTWIKAGQVRPGSTCTCINAPAEGEAMIKSILVPATGSNADNAIFAAALAVARACAAHLDFLHVRVDAVSLAASMATDGAGALASGLIERIEQESDEREQAARNAFESFCRSAGLAIAETPAGAAAPSAQWHRETGTEPYWIAAYGRAADLVVAGRPADGEGVLTESLEAALLQTGRPLLIPPASGMAALPETVAIAAKGTPESARAVTAAMPLIEMAKSVVVLTVEEEAAQPDDAAERLAAGLGWHGFAVSLLRLRPSERGAAETLLAAAQQRSALLVMGGYGHSRLREWVFGGVTERVLRAAPVPVLMTH